MADLAERLPAWRALTDAVLRAAARPAARGAALGAGLFLVGAFALHRAWFAGSGAAPVLQALAALVLLPLFGLAGSATGVGLAVTSAVGQLLPRFEDELHTLVQPLTDALVARTLGGERSVSVERFRGALERLLEVPRVRAGGRPSSPARILAGLVTRAAVRLVRRAFARRLLRRLKAEGQSLVTADAVEHFARETLASALVEMARTRVHVAHLALLALGAVATLGPIAYLIARL